MPCPGGGGICLFETSAVVRENSIHGCYAHGLGGGIAAAHSYVEIDHNVISSCEGVHYGGGIGVSGGCSGRIFDCLVRNNQTTEFGFTWGAGISVSSSSDIEIAFCTVVGNRSGLEEGAGGGISSYGPNPIHDCIVRGNWAPMGDEQIEPATLETVSYCDVEGGYQGEGNFDADPLFVDGYYLSSTAAGQGEDSPCIDVGSRTAAEADLASRTTRTDHVPDGGGADLGYHYRVSELTGVEPVVRTLGRRLVVSPNPFRAETRIRLAGGADLRLARLEILDVSGRLVRKLGSGAEGRIPAIVWDGRDESGRRVVPGVYFVRSESDGGAGCRGVKLIMVR